MSVLCFPCHLTEPPPHSGVSGSVLYWRTGYVNRMIQRHRLGRMVNRVGPANDNVSASAERIICCIRRSLRSRRVNSHLSLVSCHIVLAILLYSYPTDGLHDILITLHPICMKVSNGHPRNGHASR